MAMPAYILWMIIFDIAAVVGLLIWGGWVLFFDKRLRTIFVDDLGNLSIEKHAIKNKTFQRAKGIYKENPKAIYRRSNRIPYSLYTEGNPAPVLIHSGRAEYSSEEINNLLETDFFLKLTRVRIDIKKIMLGIFALIAVAIVVALILHFTKVIDLRQMLNQLAPPPVKAA